MINLKLANTDSYCKPITKILTVALDAAMQHDILVGPERERLEMVLNRFADLDGGTRAAYLDIFTKAHTAMKDATPKKYVYIMFADSLRMMDHDLILPLLRDLYKIMQGGIAYRQELHKSYDPDLAAVARDKARAKALEEVKQLLESANE